MWFFCDVKYSKSSPQLLLSGTYLISRIKSLSLNLSASSDKTSFSRSFAKTTPQMSSIVCSKTGILEKPSLITTSTASFIGVFISTAITSVRWVITSRTSRSSNSKILLIISACDSSMPPVSLTASTIISISSSVTASRLPSVFTPNSFRSAVAIPEAITSRGRNIVRNTLYIPQVFKIKLSEIFPPEHKRFGRFSPKTVIRIAEMQTIINNASTVSPI